MRHILSILVENEAGALSRISGPWAGYAEVAVKRVLSRDNQSTYLINGQVVREGEAAAPGVTVERIGPKSAVLRFKDRRVELPF